MLSLLDKIIIVVLSLALREFTVHTYNDKQLKYVPRDSVLPKVGLFVVGGKKSEMEHLVSGSSVKNG